MSNITPPSTNLTIPIRLVHHHPNQVPPNNTKVNKEQFN